MEVGLSIQRDLICTSTGGPASTVIWRRDGQLLNIDDSNYQQSQRVVSTVNATYETTLHIPDDSIEDYSVTFECFVLNSRGNDSSSITLEGNNHRMLRIILISILFI